MRSLFILLFATILFGSCAETTVEPILYGQLKGTVLDKNTGNPLNNVRISTSPASEIVFTNEKGEFEIEKVQAGNLVVEAQLNNYLTKVETVLVTKNQLTEVSFNLDLDDANNRPPSSPILIFPADKAEDIQRETIEFKWNSSMDKEGDEVTYTLKWFKEGSKDIHEVTEISDTTYTVEQFDYQSQYYWQVEAKDGRAKEISKSPIFTFQTQAFPRNRFYFTRKLENGNQVIFSVDENFSEAIQLTSSNENSWRPRRNPITNQIAFIRTKGASSHIFTMDYNGENVRQITTVPLGGFNLGEIDFSWSPDGSVLIYPNFDRLYSIQPDGTRTKQIYRTENGKFITDVVYSPNRQFIVVKTNNSKGYEAEIFTIDNFGNKKKEILSNLPGAVGGLDVSFDSGSILYTRDITSLQNENYRQFDTRIYLYDIVSEKTTEISIDKQNGTNDLDPRFSPDFSSVVCTNTSNDGQSKKNIIKIDYKESSIKRTVLLENAMMVDWE